MHRLLLINPNTTPSVTHTLEGVATALAPPGGVVSSRTARFGAAYISSEVGMAIAAHAVLDAYAVDAAESPQAPGAVLIGCFGDPSLAALGDVAPCPVVGLAEAAMRAAVLRGRFAVVTGGAAWAPMLRRLAFSIGLQPALADVVTVAATGAELAADPALAREQLLEACRTALARGPDVASIVVGGAALAGVAADLQSHVGVPLLDSVRCGVEAAWAAAASHRPAGTATTMPPAAAMKTWTPHPAGVDVLTDWLNRRAVS
jgi:allantoin racemase